YLRSHRIRLVHCFDFYGNILGVAAARMAGVPAVIASQRELGDLRTPLQRRVNHLAMRLADYVLVNTAVVGGRLAGERVLRPERIALIPNGVDTVRFSPPRIPRQRRDGPVVVGTVANLRPEKGLEHLVQAMALVRDRYPAERLAIWGDGSVRADLERLIQDVGLSGSVTLHGATAKPEDAMRAMDIFVLPSLSEACSNVLLEAMASGLPVVATRVGGTPALVEDEVTGLLVPAGDPAALAKAIIQLVEDPGLAERMGAGGRELVRARFGLDRMLLRVEALYARALFGTGREGHWR